MVILAIGDVVSTVGCEFLRKTLPAYKKFKSIDLCIANGENSALGNGITPESAEYLFHSGVDVITTGNHVFRRKEIYSYFDETEFLVRPGNFAPEAPGKGVCVVDMGRTQVAVMNLSGNTYLDHSENAFRVAQKLQDEYRDVKIKLLDFHAEATAEKRAMGFFLDGGFSAVFGTHTHVQTADEQILPGGTGYITDLGMTGPIQSVLGVESKLAVEKFYYGLPVHFQNPGSACQMDGCIFEIDDKSGLCKTVERVCLR